MQNKHTLLEIANSFQAIEKMLDYEEEFKNNEDDKKEVENEVINNLVEIIKEFPAKIDNIIDYNNSVQSHLALLDQKIEQLKEAKDIINRRNARFNNYIIECLDKLCITKASGIIGEISLRKPLQSLEITDIDKIPFEYLRSKTIVDVMKNEIKERIKAGEEIEGARLIDGKRSVQYKYTKSKE